RGSSPTVRGQRPAPAATSFARWAAASLNAWYCSSRAKSRSRASSSARSSSSSTAAAGSSLAAFRSSRVAATTRNSLTSSRFQSSPMARMWARKSSVTWCSATSVTSSLCLPSSCSSRSTGPVKWSSRTVEPLPVGPLLDPFAGGVSATFCLGRDHLAGELAVVAGARGGRVQGRDRRARHRRLRELHGLGDHGLVHLVTERLHHPLQHLPAVGGAAVVHGGEDPFQL